MSHRNSFYILAQLSDQEDELEAIDTTIADMIERNRHLTEEMQILDFETQARRNECVRTECIIHQTRNRMRAAEMNKTRLDLQMMYAKIELLMMKSRTWTDYSLWDNIATEDIPYFAECAIKAAEYDLQLELEITKDIMLGRV